MVVMAFSLHGRNFRGTYDESLSTCTFFVVAVEMLKKVLGTRSFFPFCFGNSALFHPAPCCNLFANRDGKGD